MTIEHDENLEPENIEEQVPESSPGEESPQGHEQAPQDPPAEPVESDDVAQRREALIAQLTGQAPREDEEEPEDEDPPETEKGDQAAPPEEEEKPEDLENIPDEEMSQLKRRTRKRIEHFRTELKKAREREPLAAYGEDIIAFAKENAIDPDNLGRWIHLGATVNKGGQEAIDALLKVAQNLGYQPPQAAPPQEQTPKQDGKLPDWLQDKVDSYDIDLEVAKDIARRLGSNAQPQTPATPPPPAAPPAPAPTAPVGPSEADLAQGAQQLEALISQAAAKYPADWDSRIYPAVKAKMAEFKGAPVQQWPRLFKLALESTVAGIRTPPKQTRAPLPPGNSNGGTKAKDPRSRLIAKLTGG